MNTERSWLGTGKSNFLDNTVFMRLSSVILGALAGIGWIVLAYRAMPLGGRLMLDFTQYYDAGRALLHNTSPYRPEARQFSSAAFLLPPIFAMMVMPLAALPVETANVIWFLLSLGFLAAGCVGVVWLTGGLSRAPGSSIAAVCLVAVLLLPVWTGAKLGQITALLFCLSTLGLALQKAGRPVLGGMLLGAAIAFKIIPITLAAFAIWAGWRRFGTSALVTFAALQLISALVFPAIFAEYWQSAIFTIPEISHAVNLSLIGMVGRLPSELASIVRPLAYFMSGVLLLLPFAFVWKTRDEQTRLLALALLIAATVTAMPLVEHHYMIWLIFPIWTLLSIQIERRRTAGLILLAMAFALLSQPYRLSRTFLAVVPLDASSEAMGEVVLTFGAMLLYILLLTMLLRQEMSARKVFAIAS